MNKALETKLKDLPKEPGVYFHKNTAGEIIYVGKAAVLRNRVRQYFQKSRVRDPKTDALVEEIADTDWMVVDSEIEALFLEAEMIRRYMPRYNILLRDDKSMSYIRIDYNSDFPTVTTTRRPLDDGARYFGPYLSALSVRNALKSLRRVFPFATGKVSGQKRATLFYHLGLDPGLEEGRTSLEDYRANLRKLMAVIEGKRRSVEKEIERNMNSLAKASEFEKAAKARNQLFALQNLTRQVIFSDKEFQDISKDHALNELVNLLSLSAVPRRIEGFDISHMQGTDVVASMVVFTNGVSNKGEYRKFKTKKDHNNDFYNMHETISRRFNLPARGQAPSRNAWKGSLPGLVLIDGGKGQLDAAIRARDEAGQSTIPFVGLAKREEQIVIKKSQELRVKRQEKQQSSSVIPVKTGIQSNSESPEAMLNPTGSRVKPGMTKGGSNVFLNVDELHRLGGFVQESEDFILVSLPHSTNLVKLLQRIRDESHRFAVSYHSVLKVKRQSASLLDDIPTIGPATRKKLIRTFGSMRGVMQARDFELDQVLGAKKATILRQYLRPLRRDQQDQAELQ